MKIKPFSLLFIIGALPFSIALSSCLKDEPFPLYNNQKPALNYTWAATTDSIQEKTYSTYLSSNGKYFIQNNAGNTSSNYWWNAHMLDVFVDGYLRTKSDVYKPRMKALLNGIKETNNGSLPNEFYDDMEWLALASLRAYEATQDVDFLNAAQLLWTDIQTGINTNQGGGVAWKKTQLDYKNTPANAPAIILASRLYKLQNKAEDLNLAKSLYQWLKATLVDPATGLAWDGINRQGNGQIDKNWIFTYNQGILIGAALEMYNVTKDKAFLSDAIRAANSTMTSTEIAPGGLLKNENQGDGGLFKGILVRYLALLAQHQDVPEADRAKVVQFLKYNAETMYKNAIERPAMLISPDWKKRPEGAIDLSSQLSGLMLLEAASTLKQQGKL